MKMNRQSRVGVNQDGGQEIREKVEGLKTVHKTGVVSTFLYIQYEKIVPDPNNRNADKNIESMAFSIRKYGFRGALTVIDKGDGTYMLISGERRWRGIGLIKKEDPIEFARLFENGKIPCDVLPADTDPVTARSTSIIMNYERESEDPKEARERLQELYDTYLNDGTVPRAIIGKISDMIDRTPRQVQKIIKINNELIPELKEYFDTRKITIDIASRFAALDEEGQKQLLNILKENGEVREEEFNAVKDTFERQTKESMAYEEKIKSNDAEKKTLETLSGIYDDRNPEEKSEKDKLISRIKELEDNNNELKALIKDVRKKHSSTIPEKSAGFAIKKSIDKCEMSIDTIIKNSQMAELTDTDKKRIMEIIARLGELI